MKSYDLADVSGNDPMRHGIGRLIELVGTPRFEEEVFRTARDGTRCEHLTAFSAQAKSRPRVLYAANVGPAIAKKVAHKYVENYWFLDPARRFEESRPRSPGISAVRITSHDIADGGYRDDCYTSVKLIDRFTVIQRRDHETVSLNFYRAAGSGPFGSSDIDRIVNAADLLISLLMKHGTTVPERRDDMAGSFMERLRLIDPTLPPRETQICGAIARGMTSEAIALTLGISINTVLTYRKRAYVRLGVSSQNELMRLVLS